ncbi:MAG: protein kinase [Gemmataceae bacterium]|nr:protein kinase [Gemmataceae bacterium]
MKVTLTLDQQLAVDECCTEFEQALRAGGSATAADYWTRGEAAGRPELLEELVAIEIDYYLSRGDAIRVEEYLSRYPIAEKAVRTAFAITRVRPETRQTAPNPQVGLPNVERFLIERELGRGGMGVVYLARQPTLNRRVALKMLRSHDTASPEQKARFEIEGELLARLQHPNIVRVYEYGDRGGLAYLAMELVDGGSLSDRLKSEAMAAIEAADLCVTLARAIEYAHRNGVIHRDIKPGNVLFSCEGVPKIADFGLALSEASEQRLTISGVIAGTPSYMAPEQAAGARHLGPAVDVYALGAVLYEMLSGRPPFLGDNAIETSRRVLSDEPVSPRKVRADVPADLATIALKCLEKDPARRYATAGELAEDLERWRRFEPIVARSAGRVERVLKWCRRQPVWATAVGMLFLAFFIATSAAVILRRERNALTLEREQRKLAEWARTCERVEGLLTTAPDRVPGLLDDLIDNRDQVLPLLLEAKNSPDRLKRFRALVGISALERNDRVSLPPEALDVPVAESRNLGRLLRVATPESLAGLRKQARESGAEQGRAAAILISAGEFEPAEEMLATTSDPTPRTRFIEEFAAWHGDVAGVIERLRDRPPAIRSGYCAALGRVDLATLPATDREAVVAAITQIYREDPDAGTHSAAGWALRQWSAAPPELARSRISEPGRGWFVNLTGQTMIAVNPGVYVRTNGVPVILTEQYYLADREVSVDLIQKFRGIPNSTPDNRPVLEIDRTEMLRFCNWLSEREGRTPCYRPNGEWDRSADGYRLPTDAEWEYALRAGATTRFFFADDPRWLPMYANIAASGPAPGGSKLPNRWGFFDMVANAWELVWDYDGSESGSLKINPTGQTTGTRWITRGGAFDSGSYDTWSGARHSIGNSRSPTVSFRVACGKPGPQVLDETEILRRLSDSPVGSTPSYERLLADLHAGARQWTRAARRYEAVLRKSSQPLERQWAFFLGGAMYMLAGETEEFTRLRREFLTNLAVPESPIAAETLAKACLIAPISPAQTELLDKLSRHGTSTGPTNCHFSYAAMTRGLFEYRAGNDAEALAWLKKSENADRLNSPSRAVLSYCQAMAYQRTGQGPKAIRALQAGDEAIASDEAAWRSGTHVPFVHDFYLALVWRAEAHRTVTP